MELILFRNCMEQKLRELIAKELKVEDRMDESEYKIVNNAYEEQLLKSQVIIDQYFHHYDTNKENGI